CKDSNPNGVVSAGSVAVLMVFGSTFWFDRLVRFAKEIRNPVGVVPLQPLDDPRVAPRRGNPGLSCITASRLEDSLDQRLILSVIDSWITRDHRLKSVPLHSPGLKR